MSKIDRIIAFVLLVLMMITMVPLQAYAEEIFTVDYNTNYISAVDGVIAVTSGTAINVTLEALDGYELPDNVTVNGVYDDVNYNKGTGNLKITNIQSDIEIFADAVMIIPEIETGTIIVRYEHYNGAEMASEEVNDGIPLGEYTFEYKNFIGYVVDSEIKSATLTVDGETIIVTFIYSEEGLPIEETGTVVVRYEDENGEELLPEEIHDEVVLGEHTYFAPEIEGYTANCNSETIIIEEDGQVRYVVFVYTADEIEEEPEINDFTNLNIIGVSCLNGKNIILDECEVLFTETDTFNGGTMIELPLMVDELQFKKMYDEDWNYDVEDYFEIGRTDNTVEFIIESSETKELTIYAVYSIPKAPQLKVVLADCSDIKVDLKDLSGETNNKALEEFVNRSVNQTHNVFEELHFNLVIGENIIDIPESYNGLEWWGTGNTDWDSRFDREDIKDEQGNKKGIKVIVPYLTDLTLYVGYILPEVEEEPEVSRPSGGSTPKVKEQVILISQEDFVARYLNHKIISKEFKKFEDSNVKFEVDRTLLNELIEEGLSPRIYRWDEAKGKLIAEATEYHVKSGNDDVYELTLATVNDRKENYYTIIAVQQPDFIDVEEFNYYIDKSNGLGLIEGIETDGVLNFEADKQISKSEYYTIIARMMGSVVEGETKMYDLLDLKSMEEAEQILEGLELEVADWSKPYVASLYEKGYITVEDLTENGNQITVNSAMRTLNKVLSEVEDIMEIENQTITNSTIRKIMKVKSEVEDLLQNRDKITIKSTIDKLSSEAEDTEQKLGQSDFYTRYKAIENLKQNKFCTRYKMVEILVNELVKLGW
jgi:hypothetical protein